MLRTRVGYCGGKKETPSYYALGDQTEAISIDYDPKVITYEQLLGYFWKAHRCDLSNRSRQYMNAVFYQNEMQQKAAEVTKAEEAQRLGITIDAVKTEIIPVQTFTYAEDYHQKHYLTRHTDVREFLIKTYPTGKALADSTVAARLNAYLGIGMNLDSKTFLNELPKFGLPASLEKQLREEAMSGQ